MKTLTLAAASVLALSLAAPALADGTLNKDVMGVIRADNTAELKVTPYQVFQQKPLDRQTLANNPALMRVEHDISAFATAADPAADDRIGERGGANFDLIHQNN